MPLIKDEILYWADKLKSSFDLEDLRSLFHLVSQPEELSVISQLWNEIIKDNPEEQRRVEASKKAFGAAVRYIKNPQGGDN